ncbi:MAG: hypothetical protein K6D56_06900 [Clostridia bacterium]|jgi:hypothetical protein|nr:hypothetical protein [Clostridia bacterium]
MKTGRIMAEGENVTPRNVGKAITGLLALGLAAGVALVAGTNMIMSTLFPESAEKEDEE